jgi:hypothetical protein
MLYGKSKKGQPNVRLPTKCCSGTKEDVRVGGCTLRASLETQILFVIKKRLESKLVYFHLNPL